MRKCTVILLGQKIGRKNEVTTYYRGGHKAGFHCTGLMLLLVITFVTWATDFGLGNTVSSRGYRYLSGTECLSLMLSKAK